MSDVSALDVSALDTPSHDTWMQRALTLAVHPDAPIGMNPRVGCVILDVSGDLAGEGFHHGAGTPHAEVEALRQAGDRARGGTAFVTLEPCSHHGRTGPCTEALITAGITRVVFAVSDPHGAASGGAAALMAAGVEVEAGVLADQARLVNREWLYAHEHGRPFVRWKIATTLDHRVARNVGTRTQISGAEASDYVQNLRRQAQAILIGTSTAIIDNPHLTVRGDRVQPLRVVMGMRDIPVEHHLHDGEAELLQLRTHEPERVLRELWERGIVTVLLEGGPTCAAAFLQAGLVDEIAVIQAPVVWGTGPEAFLAPFEADLEEVRVLGEDVVLTLVPHASER